MDETDKRLKFLREMEKLRLKVIRDSEYKSPFDKDVMVFKGPEVEDDLIRRINVGTEKIDTQSEIPVISGQQFKDKIESLKKKPSRSSFAQTKSKMLPGVSSMSLGADLLSGDTEKAADNLAGDVLQSAPSMIAKGIGKIAPKAAGMALKAANPLGLLIGEALGSEKVGEGSDQSLNESQARDVELVRDVSKDDDTMNSARFKALQRMMSK